MKYPSLFAWLHTDFCEFVWNICTHTHIKWLKETPIGFGLLKFLCVVWGFFLLVLGFWFCFVVFFVKVVVVGLLGSGGFINLVGWFGWVFYITANWYFINFIQWRRALWQHWTVKLEKPWSIKKPDFPPLLSYSYASIFITMFDTLYFQNIY